nr:uncharacterized protein LOC107454107 [Parasteatoda tepidariorum]
MNRTGLKFTLQDKQIKQQQQKQKKRLSFRDPEVEGPQQQSQIYGGCRPKALIPSSKPKTGSQNVDNFTLEDQALQIAQSVGSAFSGLSLQTDRQTNLYNSTDFLESTQNSVVETNIEEFPENNSSFQSKRSHLSPLKLSFGDQDFLERDLIMRCPTIEPNEHTSAHNSIPTIELLEEKYPSSAQHQIQLLKYQLDQQCQQTRMALYQVQLLTDQMEAECAARHKAQEQNNQLMLQNQDLLKHIEKLFQQIEELEKHIHFLELDKKSKIPQLETQVSQPRASFYMGTRRLSGDQTSEIKPQASMGQTPASRSSFTTTKPLLPQTKVTSSTMQPNTLAATRRSSLTSPKPFTAAQMRNDSSSTLHIGDTSPPVQSGPTSPFSSSWRLKTPEPPTREKSPTVPERTRTSSFSALSKLKPPEINTKTSFFSGSNTTSAITNKKHSSSTSDLYNSNVFHSSKPSLVLDDASSSGKSAISSVSATPASKLPRYQAYSGWQRRSSLTKESEQNSTAGKDKLRHF